MVLTLDDVTVWCKSWFYGSDPDRISTKSLQGQINTLNARVTALETALGQATANLKKHTDQASGSLTQTPH